MRINTQVAELTEQETAKGWASDVNPGVKDAVLTGENLAHKQGYVDHLHQRTGKVKNMAAAERMIDNLVVYYEVSWRHFTENVVILAIENELVSELPKILNAGKFAGMDDDTILDIAAESEQVQQTRARLMYEVEKLREGIALCEADPRRKRSPLARETAPTTEKPVAFKKGRGATVEEVD